MEDVARELTEGNLHSALEYHSEDEIGRLAHSMRKSIRILGTYVDDIDRAMKLFSEGNFDVQPEVEWKGDFVGILNSFMSFEKSMAETIKGIKNVSSEVSSAADQVASSSNDLADGATNQAAVVEELTATVAGVSEQVEKIHNLQKQSVEEWMNLEMPFQTAMVRCMKWLLLCMRLMRHQKRLIRLLQQLMKLLPRQICWR